MCGSACTIYKEGRKHRVLVCPHCGVLATNPTLAGSIFKGVVGSIPVVGGVASEVIGNIQGRKAQKEKPSMAHTDAHRRSNFEKALMMELAER